MRFREATNGWFDSKFRERKRYLKPVPADSSLAGNELDGEESPFPTELLAYTTLQ